jgi:transcriptional regulator with PAS, ATPase and Fis domain
MIKHSTLSDTESRSLEPERRSESGQPSSLGGIDFDSIIGESAAMRELIDLGKRLSRASLPSVLIQGETGTGKELFARALHNSSAQRDASLSPFVEINSTAIPENLLEAELFGYEQGAFTDAKRMKRGLLEVADGGTLFLDEIGNMSLGLQAKLLNVLEERRFRRIGGTAEIQVGVRIMAATNADLEAAIRDGFFREDLFYRLAVVAVALPALRERERDALLLAKHFLRQFCQQHQRPLKRLDPQTQRLLVACPWPGNVRELRNAIQRAVLLSPHDVICPEDITLGVRSMQTLGQARSEAAGKIQLSFDPEKTSLADAERAFIRRMLDHHGWNKSRTAEKLRISRPRLLRKIKSLELESGSAAPQEAPHD